MAGASMKDIKSRIKRMESTRQITGAMEAVAASKLRGAQVRAAASRPYFEVLYQTMHDIAENSRGLSSPYLQGGKGGTACFVVIAGDRGLAGGYNSSVLRLAAAEMADSDAVVLPIGKKAAEYFRGRGIPLFGGPFPGAENVTAGECFAMAADLCQGYLAGAFCRVVLCYTGFVTALTQTPSVLPLLPLSGVGGGAHAGTRRSLTEYEPDSETVFNTVVPQYLGGVICGALRESLCSEQAARRAAMDSAARNAGEMIGELNLRYNRVRQGVITREITEIVAGAER